MSEGLDEDEHVDPGAQADDDDTLGRLLGGVEVEAHPHQEEKEKEYDEDFTENVPPESWRT